MSLLSQNSHVSSHCKCSLFSELDKQLVHVERSCMQYEGHGDWTMTQNEVNDADDTK